MRQEPAVLATDWRAECRESAYSCTGCRGDIVLTYEDKMKLFANGAAPTGEAPTERSQGPQRWDALTDPAIAEGDPPPEGC